MKTQRDLQEDHVKMEAEMGIICQQAKGCQRLLSATRSQEKGREQIFPQSLQKKPTLLTP